MSRCLHVQEWLKGFEGQWVRVNITVGSDVPRVLCKQQSSSITLADALQCRQIPRTIGTIWSGRFVFANTSCSLILCECGCGTTQINRTVVKYWHSMSVNLLTDSDVALSDDRFLIDLHLLQQYFQVPRMKFLLKFKLFQDKQQLLWKKKSLDLITLGNRWS